MKLQILLGTTFVFASFAQSIFFADQSNQQQALPQQPQYQDQSQLTQTTNTPVVLPPTQYGSNSFFGSSSAANGFFNIADSQTMVSGNSLSNFAPSVAAQSAYNYNNQAVAGDVNSAQGVNNNPSEPQNDVTGEGNAIKGYGNVVKGRNNKIKGRKNLVGAKCKK